MRFARTAFAGLVAVSPERNVDERGHFVRVFCETEFSREGLLAHFPQISQSFNKRSGTVRGMHFQRPPYAETKVVRCTRGAIFDVIIDLRPDEPTFCQWQGFELSAKNGEALYIPTGFAHGFQTLEDDTEVTYMITPTFTPGRSTGVCWDDPAIAVAWPLPVSVISAQDQAWLPFTQEQS